MTAPTAPRFPSWLKVSLRPLLRLLSAIPGFKPSLRVISRRSGGSRWFFRSFPVEGTIELRAPDGTTLKYFSTVGDFIGRDLYWFGWNGFEPETTGLFLSLARRATVVVDVGANTGLYSLLAGRANDSCRIMAIEPVARVRELLERNLELNGLSERCVVVPGAASRAHGTLQFHVPYGAVPTSASLNVDGFRGYRGEVVDVLAHVLDDLCAKYERIDLLKIDVEGFEDHVLEGATGVLDRSAPIIIVECIPDGPCRTVQALLEPHGYTFFRITSEGLQRMERIEPDTTKRFRNVLCLPAKAELP